MSAAFNSIITLSDVSVGYGTPQVVSISQSMAERYDASCLILEPDQPERPPRPIDAPDVTVERVYTSNHPYALSGQTEFCLLAAERIDQEKPDVVILCSFLGAGAVLKMKHKPSLVIYYGLEHTDERFQRERRLFNLISDRIDLCVFPEENRARLEKPRLGLKRQPTAIAYNGAAESAPHLDWDERNGRFFYGGLLHPQRTYADYFFGGELDDVPLDLYGLLDGYDDETALISSLSDRRSEITYNGYVPRGPGFLDLLCEYDFSIVMWAPIDESTRFAAPNKFFDAIATHVPPIVAPHPLCRQIITRYRCGILMDGWSIDDLKNAIERAQNTQNTGEFAEMIEERLPQAARDLSWPAQFEKVAAAIEKLVKDRENPKRGQRDAA